MSWASALQDPGWRTWLLDVAGGSRVRTGAKLDPFGTSWRSLSGQARRWLPLIRAGKPFADSQRRTDQTVIDLRAANLVAGPAALTPFGEAVYKRWTAIPDSWEYELPLAVALLQEALIAEQATFGEMIAYWWDIRSRFGDDGHLLRDEEAVILLPYMNQSSAGFNPWVALRDHAGPLQLPVPWNDLETAAGGDAAARTALVRLRGVLDPSRRLKSRVVFCRAMSLLILRRENPGTVTPYLQGLELPRRTERS
jgi:hypothetical protein